MDIGDNFVLEFQDSDDEEKVEQAPSKKLKLDLLEDHEDDTPLIVLGPGNGDSILKFQRSEDERLKRVSTILEKNNNRKPTKRSSPTAGVLRTEKPTFMIPEIKPVLGKDFSIVKKKNCRKPIKTLSTVEVPRTIILVPEVQQVSEKIAVTQRKPMRTYSAAERMKTEKLKTILPFLNGAGKKNPPLIIGNGDDFVNSSFDGPIIEAVQSLQNETTEEFTDVNHQQLMEHPEMLNQQEPIDQQLMEHSETLNQQEPIDHHQLIDNQQLLDDRELMHVHQPSSSTAKNYDDKSQDTHLSSSYLFSNTLAIFASTSASAMVSACMSPTVRVKKKTSTKYLDKNSDEYRRLNNIATLISQAKVRDKMFSEDERNQALRLENMMYVDLVGKLAVDLNLRLPPILKPFEDEEGVDEVLGDSFNESNNDNISDDQISENSLQLGSPASSSVSTSSIDSIHLSSNDLNCKLEKMKQQQRLKSSLSVRKSEMQAQEKSTRTVKQNSRLATLNDNLRTLIGKLYEYQNSKTAANNPS